MNGDPSDEHSDGSRGEDAQRIDALASIVQEQGLDALTVRFDETTYEIVRNEAQPVVFGAQVEAAAPAAAAIPAPAPPSGARYKKVTAPIVGVYYRASAPGAEPFVNVGDRVEVGQVVCILEAMKLMNEITTDYAGVIRRILPENGALVSLGEEMLWIEP
ncbi:MAG TPA: biotin/lipoyl-containing protein [Candidatus Baltobacteraceae bacterium]